ncbi:hypothetical protein O181_025618 [Austropuccinia psidii MF-1]|uniref:Uncharacterized protein n=1 Tax=Austropuccinia psidii MF-1 TaxID=1389203 RepID=A0A9Q3GZA1_9BASI|nr:hypothetical protein [Austropuccinia psidii MF-1]
MASTKNWKPIPKVSSIVNTPQPEVYPGSSNQPQLESDEELYPNLRPSPKLDNLNQQSLHTSPKVMKKPFDEILENKFSQGMPNFQFPKFLTVPSPVAYVPSTRISFPSVSNPPSSEVQKRTPNYNREVNQLEVDSIHPEEPMLEIGVLQKEPEASNCFENVSDIGVSENARSNSDYSVSEIGVTESVRSASQNNFNGNISPEVGSAKKSKDSVPQLKIPNLHTMSPQNMSFQGVLATNLLNFRRSYLHTLQRLVWVHANNWIELLRNCNVYCGEICDNKAD